MNKYNECIMKIQINNALKDVKPQLERCKDAHMDFMKLLNHNEIIQEGVVWVEDLYKIWTDLNHTVTDHYNKENKGKGLLKMETMKYPSFSGELRRYTKFQTDFMKHVMPSVPSKESAAYVLKSCLEGRAKELVHNTDDNIENMWSRLDEKYGDLSKVADLVINDIRRLKHVKEGDNKKFIEFIQIIERGYRDLTLLNIEKEILNTGTVSLIEERLPRDVRRDWSKEVKKSGSSIDIKDKFPYLLKFLQEQRKVIEYEYSDLRISNAEVSRSGVYLMESNDDCHEEQAEVLQFRGTSRCIFHNSNGHKTEDCVDFKAMDITSRIQLIREKICCWSCMKVGHRVANCRNKAICEVQNCKKYHHTLLHEEIPNPVLLAGKRSGGNICLLPLMNILCRSQHFKCAF